MGVGTRLQVLPTCLMPHQPDRAEEDSCWFFLPHHPAPTHTTQTHSDKAPSIACGPAAETSALVPVTSHCPVCSLVLWF